MNESPRGAEGCNILWKGDTGRTVVEKGGDNNACIHYSTSVCINRVCTNIYTSAAEIERVCYMNSMCSVSGLTGESHKINRENVLTDVMTLYEPSPGPAFLEEFPFRVQFEGERAMMWEVSQWICSHRFGKGHTSTFLMEVPYSPLLSTTKWICKIPHPTNRYVSRLSGLWNPPCSPCFSSPRNEPPRTISRNTR